MKPKYQIIAAAFAVSVISSVQLMAASLPAPAPEFRSLAQLREDHSTRSGPTRIDQKIASDSTIFYTGKIADSNSGIYIFLFRGYDSELSRWNAADPSGFPDGPNAFTYVKSPLNEFDFSGLFALSTTSPSPATASDPSGKFYSSAFTLSHIDAGAGMANTLSGLLNSDYGSFSVTGSNQNLAGSVNVQQYRALNTDRRGGSAGALDLQMIFQQAANDFSWIQIARGRSSSNASWSSWFVDTTGFGSPSYNSIDDPKLYDWPTLGAWSNGEGGASGASKEFYTFATIKASNAITIHDAVYWGGIVKE